MLIRCVGFEKYTLLGSFNDTRGAVKFALNERNKCQNVF